MTILENDRIGIIYGLADSRAPEFIRYIGFTTKPIVERVRNHSHDSGKNLRTNWIKSVKKSGGKLIIVEIDNGHISELPELEKMYIKLFRSFGAPLVNGNWGGIGCLGYRWNEEQKNRKRGIPSPFIGKTYEEIHGEERGRELRRIVGDKSLGRKPKYKSRPKFTEERRKKHSSIRQNKYHNNPTKIVQYDLNGNKIAEYASTLEAGRKTGLCDSRIKVNCRGFVMRHYKKGLTKELVTQVHGFVFKREPK